VAWKLLHMYVCPCFVCSMVYMQSNSAKNIIKDIDFYTHMRHIAGCSA